MSIKQLYAQGYNSNPSEPGCVHRLFQLHGGRLDWLLCAATWMHHTGCNPVALSGGDAALYQTPSVHTAIPQTVGMHHAVQGHVTGSAWLCPSL